MSHDVFHVQVDIGVGGDGRSRFVPRDVRVGSAHRANRHGEKHDRDRSHRGEAGCITVAHPARCSSNAQGVVQMQGSN